MNTIQSITIRNLKFKTRKIEKTYTSSDYYYNDVFVFNEVDCYSKTNPSQIVSYQYFTQLSLTKCVADKIANEFGGYTSANDSKSSSYYIYFNDTQKAINFINSEYFIENYLG